MGVSVVETVTYATDAMALGVGRLWTNVVSVVERTSVWTVLVCRTEMRSLMCAMSVMETVTHARDAMASFSVGRLWTNVASVRALMHAWTVLVCHSEMQFHGNAIPIRKCNSTDPAVSTTKL